MIRKLLRLLLLLLVLLIVAAAAAWVYIDHLAAQVLTGGVEFAGDAPCTVGAVDVSLPAGSIDVTELTVGHPAGFEHGDMFTLRRAALEVEVGTLWRGCVHVRRLEVIAPLVRIVGKDGRSNLATFLDNVRAKTGVEGGPDTRLRVDRVVIDGAKVQIGSGLSGEGLVAVELDRFELTDLHGPDGRGVTAGELMAKILFECAWRGAVKARLNLDSVLPPELTKGLEIVATPLSVVFKGTGDLILSPWRALLGPATRPQARPKTQQAARQ